MTQTVELGIPGHKSGRQIKFTPERIQQIKNLVERGKSREEIAELIGVTVGSLQVTCSRFGISLRRPTLTISLRREEPRFNRVSTPGSNGSDSALPQLIIERPEKHAQDAALWQEWAKRTTEAGAANFAIRIQYRGEERTIALPLTQDMISQLAFDAVFRNVTIGELIGELIVAGVNKDLLREMLDHKKP
jgi:hypothetical protein